MTSEERKATEAIANGVSIALDVSLRKLTKTFFDKLFTFILVVWLATAALNWVLTKLEVGFDSTDGNGERSGLALHIDHGTGCEYLVTKQGGITPRLTKTGEHYGCH